ncbi:MAG: bifunctional metallophosphatase/5'-nucleotidase [Lewinellaceae bacterium]|nr:bifunctional metallophosphatase/5'-nucleotidase [Lewinella sp.]MCB9280077.1 bifunctional metallophosphatase/5'-nucleotidase [Lewinellaceae bacterium]
MKWFTTRRKLGLLLIIMTVLGWSCGVRREAGAGEEVSFTILQLNDVYEIAPLEGGKAGGLARVATVKKELLAENPNTIAVIAGDFLSPSFIGTLKMKDGERIAGLQMVETLNAMGLDYATFGNHEFDLKDADLLQKRIDQSHFKFVCSNAFRVDNGERRPFTQNKTPIPPYIIREFTGPGGKKVTVGLTGVVLPFNKADYAAYGDVTESFRASVNAMKARTDVMIGITHLAVDDDIALAKAVPGLPLIIGGHDHTNMMRESGNTVITKADANAKTVYIHRFTYNTATHKTTLRSTLRSIGPDIADDPETEKVVDRWLGQVDDIAKAMGYEAGKVVYQAKTPLICTEDKVRSEQTNFGTLTTEAFEFVWPGADVYLINGGAMRLDDNISGAVTVYDIMRTFPFGGPIARIHLPGSVLKRFLDTSQNTNKTEGGYMQLNHAEATGSGYRIGNAPLDPNKTYAVILPQFVAEGKEANLDFLKDFPNETREQFDTHGAAVKNDIRDIVIRYMEEGKD